MVNTQIRCREIAPSDSRSVIDLLTKGFDRERQYWVRAWERLARRATPDGYPRFGYLLECGGDPVGVLLLIHSHPHSSDTTGVRCNVSSWYVEPEFRGYAAVLASRAARHREVTYFNLTPARHTWPILEAMGYKHYAKGFFVGVPALSRPRDHRRVRAVTRDVSPGADLPADEIDLLLAHADCGCFSLICGEVGVRHPFIFGKYRHPLRSRGHWVRGLPLAHLVYCRDLRDFAECAGPVGRFLALRGYAGVVVTANEPVRGAPGRFFGERPRFFKGPNPPRLGDETYSEQVLFGF